MHFVATEPESLGRGFAPTTETTGPPFPSMYWEWSLIHRRTISNTIWSLVIIAGLGAAAYFFLPGLGDWLRSAMGSRDTMNRPSSVDVRDQLPRQ